MMIKKIRNFKFVIHNCQKGMSYVELIVVLGIFSVLASVSFYNYGEFQANVDIRNLASDIALQIVTAQKNSLNGVLPSGGVPFDGWKPSYGVYFNKTTGMDNSNPTPTLFNKEFVYFTDLSNPPDGYTFLDVKNFINITKNNSILSIQQCNDEPCGLDNGIDSLTIAFKRPDSSAVFRDSNGTLLTGFDYIKITIKSPKENTSFIRIYPSGRVQVN